MSESLHAERLQLFPSSARIQEINGSDQITIGKVSLLDLAHKFGTPLYVYDRACMDQAVQIYKDTLARKYPGEAALTYAAKAFLCLAVGEWINEQNLWLDCTGANELAVGVKAGIPRSHLLQHGVSKTQEDIIAAIRWAGTIVMDNLQEIEQIFKLMQQEDIRLPDVWLRLRPGLNVETHNYTQTGGESSKFGFGMTEFETGIGSLLERGIVPNGLHFHLGSHFHDPTPLASAIETALDLVKVLSRKYNWEPAVFCPGGGWGVPYHESELPHKTVQEYVGFICEKLIAGCRNRGLRLPRLQLEPGRSIIARAGVAIYQVQAVKQAQDRRWLLVDGGLADNPRPALYQARYSALTVAKPERPSAGLAWIGGPYCESSDVLIHALPMPEVDPGEYLAVPVSGAYQVSMSSNYNGALRPSIVWLEDGIPKLIRRRETLDDLIQRDYTLRQ